MLNIEKIFIILSRKERVRSVYLLFLIISMALIDMIGIVSVMPFIALLTNPEIIFSNKIINFAYQKSIIFGVEDEKSFLILTGFFVFFLLIISIIVKALTAYFQSRYIRYCEYSLSKRLIRKYIYQPYSWFLNQNSSEIGKTILSETGNVIGKGLGPAVSLITNIIVTLTLLIMLLYVDIKLTLIVAITVGLFYMIFYLLIRKLLNKVAKKNFKDNGLKFKA